MGKNQSASNLTNIIKQDASGNITFVSGSTTLLSVSSSGAIATTGNVAGTASYATNAELLDGLDSTVFTLTSSFTAQTASFTAFTSSVNSFTSSLNLFSASILTFTASQNILNGTYSTTGSNTFRGSQYISSSFAPTNFTDTASLYTDGGLRVTRNAYLSSSLYINGDLIIFGSQSVNYISSSQLDIADNIITVNTSTPTLRFGGLAVKDSGSLGTGLTGSLLWDSQDNQWIYSNPSGSEFDSAVFLVGPRNYGTIGNEVGITTNALAKGNGLHHMTSSGIFESGSNIGIGTSNPLQKLHILGSGANTQTLLLESSNANSNAYAVFKNTSKSYITGLSYDLSHSYIIYDETVNVPRLIVSSVGNIGIGTSTVTEGTQAAGSISIFPSSSVSSAPLIQFPGNGRIRPASTGDRLSIDGNALYLNSYIGGNILMNTAGGNTGIGTSTPEGPLHVNGAVGAGYVGMAISNYANNIGTTSGIDFGTDMSTCYNGNGNGQISVTNTDGTTMKSEMNLKIWNGSTVVTGIKISDAGRVSFPTATAQNYGLSNATAVTINSGSGTIASCSITSVGKPILINLTGDINPIGGPSWCYLYIYRNGSPIGKLIIAESPGASTNIPFALSTIDIPGAGTHTYTGYTTIGGANPIQFGETGNNQAPTILAVELL